jgi:AAA+ ATPase superfamily predicted ATPase
MKEKVEATFGGGLKFIWQGRPSIFSSFDTDTMVIEGNLFRMSKYLILQFSLSSLADQQTTTQQIDSFKQQIYEYTHDDFLNKTQFENWDQFFSYLSKTLQLDKRLVMAIDEITYLIKSTPAFPSILQKYWDTFFSKTRICLIVCGSLKSRK